jgi:hypothetical protein
MNIEVRYSIIFMCLGLCISDKAELEDSILLQSTFGVRHSIFINENDLFGSPLMADPGWDLR